MGDVDRDIVVRLGGGDDSRIGPEAVSVGPLQIPVQCHIPLCEGDLAREFGLFCEQQLRHGFPRSLDAGRGPRRCARRRQRSLDATGVVVVRLIGPEHLSEAWRQVVLVEITVLRVEFRCQHKLDHVKGRVTHPSIIAVLLG
jgi:hypothetical protein